MTQYEVNLEPKAGKQLAKLHGKDLKKVTEALRSLAIDPWRGKPLGLDLKGHHVIRAWPYRIIYRIEQEIITVTVVTIGHRKDVYRKM